MAFFIVWSVVLPAFGAVQKQILDAAQASIFKKKITELSIKKNRSEALKLFQDLNLDSATIEVKQGLLEAKENLLSLFFNQESSDLFESSASALFQNKKNAEKSVLRCLELEPENLFCRWQYLRILKIKNDAQFILAAESFKTDTTGLPMFGYLASTLSQDDYDKFDNKPIFQEKQPILYYFYEFERALKSQNFSLAKDILQKLTLLAEDSPNLLYMRAKLIELSSEGASEDTSQILIQLYQKKCANLKPELARKYYYDIMLCQRSI